jgi:gamma-glutamylcyclotransferase (GGCT)/AIG2-like uncharacterized protein YtfP
MTRRPENAIGATPLPINYMTQAAATSEILALLFVYGTLRRGFQLHHHLTRLGARFLAEAKVAGELFERRRYPGARPPRRMGRWIHGELFRLRQPQRDLKILDKVEGFYPAAPERSEFVRGMVEVVAKNGAQQAWIYWLGAPDVQEGLDE